MVWWEYIDDPVEVIKAGVGFALNGEWDVVDEVIVPAYRRLLESLPESKGKGACGVEKYLVSAMRSILEESIVDTSTYLENGDLYEVTEIQGRLLDYFATIAREYIACQRGRACKGLIHILRDVTKVKHVYAKFRAALALKEATKYCEMLKGDLEWIERKLKEAINEDLELAKILAEMLE